MAGQGSARVTLREIDLSQVRDPDQTPQGVPAAVVGPAKRGPAFVPTTFATIQQFNETFGNMLEVDKISNSNLFAPLAINEWMKNAQAGTFLRVLGVGDGLKATQNKVTNAGFKLGSFISHDASNNLADNEHIYDDSDDKRAGATNEPTSAGLLKGSRTYMFGALMSDKAGSRFLTDAGVQPEETAASLVDVISAASVVNGDTITIFMPKQLVNDKATTAVDNDITITIKVVTNLPAFNAGTVNIPDDTVNIALGDAGDDVANFIERFLKANKAAGGTSSGLTNDTNNSFRFNKLSINPSEHFTVANGTDVGHQRTITLKSTKKEGDEVVLTQTIGGTTILGAASKTLTGAATSAPVIRGVLMTPQGVIPAINVASNETHYADYTGSTTEGAIADGSDLINFGDTAPQLFGYQVGQVDANDSIEIVLNGFKHKDNLEPKLISCSFDPERSDYFANVLNTDPTKIEEKGHYLYAHWDIDPAIVDIATGNSAFCIPSTGANDIPNFDSFESRFRTAASPWITSQLFGKGSTSSRGTTLSNSGAYKLFKLHALDDGEVANTRFRVLVSNLRSNGTNKYGSFDLTLESFDSDPINGSVLIAWRDLNLDPDSRNYIARVIGDKHTFYNFDKDLIKQRLEETGDFDVRNKYVRVEMHDLVKQAEVPVNSLPASFGGLKALNTKWSSGTKIFVEAGDNGAAQNLLLTAHAFDKLVVTPLPFVKSVSKQSGSTISADSRLPWGIKFAKKLHAEDDLKELSQINFNHSIASWTKYFPDLGETKAVLEGDAADSFENGYFSMEKIAVKVVSNAIDWSSAQYCRDGVLPAGYTRFLETTADATGTNVKYFKFRTVMQGGFDGVNIFDKEKAQLTSTAAHREANNETSITGTNTFTGPTVDSYKRAIDVLSDKSATEFQLLAIPGIREPIITDYAVSACELRFDAMFIMDIEESSEAGIDNVILDATTKSHVRNTIARFSARSLDSSFAAAYYPDIIVRRPSNSSPIQVPPSVCMLGVMSLNDTLADPWFAPAGLTRGRLNAVNSKVQMNRTLLDELYDVDINPIYEPAGRQGEVYAFGQKTLLQDQSALDRINVRRLLINIRRKVKNIANTLLFEPNRESTLAKFSALVEPIMAEVQARQGVERYKVQIDTTTTTQNDVENNTIRGKIYLQPTKSIEFISLDFVVTNSID